MHIEEEVDYTTRAVVDDVSSLIRKNVVTAPVAKRTLAPIFDFTREGVIDKKYYEITGVDCREMRKKFDISLSQFSTQKHSAEEIHEMLNTILVNVQDWEIYALLKEGKLEQFIHLRLRESGNILRKYTPAFKAQEDVNRTRAMVRQVPMEPDFNELGREGIENTGHVFIRTDNIMRAYESTFKRLGI